ncbi:hypothetical protein [Reticulibacter mediterranei]|uniref:hypothetical protein n=1 Tax=Reticulibacter mediterranei TaxID=2778369 RepID=UPI001C692A2E|nr:hypothetical protein [Reticulibacter mediterranei]
MGSPPAPERSSSPPASHPVFWRDWQRRFHRRPLVLATLNNAALALMDLLGVKRVPDQMRLFDAQPHLAVFLLMERGMIALGL